MAGRVGASRPMSGRHEASPLADARLSSGARLRLTQEPDLIAVRLGNRTAPFAAVGLLAHGEANGNLERLAEYILH